MLKKKAVIFVLLMSVTLAGCAGKADGRRREAEALLEEKYREEFTVTEYDGQEMGRRYYAVTAYSDSLPDLPFAANVDADGSGVSDGYVCRKVCRKISDRVYENLSDIIPYDIYVHTGMLSEDSVCADPNISIEEFTAEWEPDNRYYIYVHIDNRNWDKTGIEGYLPYALSGLSCLKGNITVYFSAKDTMEKAKEYVDTHTGLFDGYFDLVERKAKVEWVQYGIEDGMVLEQF